VDPATGPSTGPAGGPPDGRRIAGRYRLESVLGRGGMGVVWAAHDELLGRPVAVKEVLTAPGLTPEQVTEARARTLHEARTAARLSSPAAVLVYDVVEEDGEPWVVMERLPSRTLADELAQRRTLPPPEVATLGLRLLDALDAAHTAGVLHRDVKPANVMFRGAPQMSNAILTDFGIARLLGDPATTATGTLIGSPAFVAPERARGDKASPASDLWSLGVTLWIAAEGVSPFSREGTLQTLTAVLTADPPPVRQAGPLGPVLTGLLRKDPAERLSSRRVRSALERVAATGPSAAGVDQTATLPVPVPRPVARSQAGPGPVAGTGGGSGSRSGAVAAGAVAGGALPEVPPAEAPPAGPAGSPASDGPAEPLAGPVEPARRSRRGLLAGVLAGLVVLGLGAVAVLLLGDRTPGSEAAGSGSGAPSSGAPTISATSTARPTSTRSSSPTSSHSPSSSDSPTSRDSPTSDSPSTTDRPSGSSTTRSPSSSGSSSPSSSSTSGSAEAAASVPRGMRRYTDPSGFSVAVPRGWRPERGASGVYLRDPNSPAYLLVATTDQPKANPVADWQDQERSVSRRLPNYRLIGIRPISVRGWRGADWEFTHGQGTHVLNRNLVTGAHRAYALYWSAPDRDWSSSEAEFEQVTRSFSPQS
jgi:serine/threonine protein kinase